ncbi:MAG TPA: FHA domain-containing protein [Candidatus Scatomonas pullistercoris]|uniref:FHA domain-containing protein n=1 Tax=Candidatus Scatomonas pullistercoris TaxID=2840920 RepID=A0A9D1TAM4_9FIRM|nr:FHA domain-containing protein [Candidatus Scatomonas pullistercoris]
MNLVRCNAGHFYDRDKFPAGCPYCRQAKPSVPPDPASGPAANLQAVQPKPPAAPGRAEVPAPAPKSAPAADENLTVGYYARSLGVEPVVGWLVCIKGEYRGQSFCLKAGRNFIGRAASMDVVLSLDHSVSRFRHAAVIYEPRSRTFLVDAGEARELCYLNGEVILSGRKMEAYDILDLGNTSLMLVPCCGERFSWEEGLKA